MTTPPDQSELIPAALHRLLDLPVALAQGLLIYVHAEAPQLLQRGADHAVAAGLRRPPPGRRLHLGGLGVVRRRRHAALHQGFLFLSAVCLLKAAGQLTLRLKERFTVKKHPLAPPAGREWNRSQKHLHLTDGASTTVHHVTLP